MGEVVNLRRARKAKARAEAAETAVANRARHGETKASKAAREQAAERLRRHVEAHQLEGGANDDQKP
jgi:hypothetical protein